MTAPGPAHAAPPRNWFTPVLGFVLAVVLVLFALYYWAKDDDYRPTGATVASTTRPASTPTSAPASPASPSAPTSTLAPQSDSSDNKPASGPCRLDKVGTWSEGNNAHRIEVGGHGAQHLDYYPTPGVKSVSYIVDNIPNPDGVPAIVWGYGSLWEGDTPECATYDWLKDATAYARARLDSGHSGLVVHNGKVVANVGNLNDEDSGKLVNNFVIQGPSGSASAQASASCKDAVREDHNPVVGETWSPSGDWRIVNFWTNEKGYDQAERKLILMPGENPALFGGGASFAWPSSCDAVVKQEFEKNSLPAVTLDQLRREGLVG